MGGINTLHNGEDMNQRYWQNWDTGDAAKKIDEYWLASESAWRKTLARDMRSEFGKTALLEVGCGTGLIYRELLHQGVATPDSYTGGDVSKSMLSIARRRFPGVRFLEMDIFNLPYGDGLQPNVASIHVLQHLPYYEDAVRELMRITGRTLYICSWFTLDVEDELVFSQPSDNWDGQSFQNNTYSLSKFLKFILTTCEKNIARLQVRHFYDKNYAITLSFTDNENHSLESFLASTANSANGGMHKIISVLRRLASRF